MSEEIKIETPECISIQLSEGIFLEKMRKAFDEYQKINEKMLRDLLCEKNSEELDEEENKLHFCHWEGKKDLDCEIGAGRWKCLREDNQKRFFRLVHNRSYIEVKFCPFCGKSSEEK